MDRLHQMVGDSEVMLFAAALVAGVVCGALGRLALGLRERLTAGPR